MSTIELSDKLELLSFDNGSKENSGTGKHVSKTPRFSAPTWLIASLIVALTVCAVLLALLLLREPGAAKETSVAQDSVTTAETSPSSSTGRLVASGFIVAQRTATVGAQTTGAIESILVKEGDYVERGQVVGLIDSAIFASQVSQATAQIDVANASVTDLGAQRREASNDLQRKETLAERGFVTRVALEQAQARVQSIDAQISAANASIRNTRARAQEAQIGLSRTRIRAPFAGVVVSKNAEVGEIISPISAGGGFTRTGLLTLVDMDSLVAEVDVSEAYLDQVGAGQTATLSYEAFTGETFAARVVTIVPSIDRGKATVTVRLELLDRDPRILPNMTVSASFDQNGDVQ